METITIKVPEKTAEEWKKASPKARARMEKAVSDQIEEWISQSKFTKLDILLEEMRNEAKANGLTEEILKEILNEDE